MSRPNDGGPAFPGGERYVTRDLSGMVTNHSKAPLTPGMTLRQWYAGRLQFADPVELTKAAGLYWGADNSVWSDASNRMGQFTDWWVSLSITQRFDLIAKVRFAYADAMIRAEGGES